MRWMELIIQVLKLIVALLQLLEEVMKYAK
ncbi:type I toxin-antitoxin system toxin TisB [Enterobacteriaceae bacterium H11S18]|nr:type I toxin-antitoxin system toxin TisB [Dryocola clanedunensis]MCT4704750.1 type I toxin-antitoxin system toxin TisB [Dryocola clanedunensis]MCT4711903.1 type I toxin-antitoxin system toxin TisB [Dryocola clanedunensis]